ncbi:MAG: glycosyltransferase involved in cell wall biosynthesis, partial [Rhodothermales bacterium]
MCKLSVYMITFNNTRTVEATLKALQWADEIVVVDSFSTDGTLEITKKYATKVEQRPWPGFRDQYQYAADACSHEWLMFVDADEVIPEELAQEI